MEQAWTFILPHTHTHTCIPTPSALTSAVSLFSPTIPSSNLCSFQSHCIANPNKGPKRSKPLKIPIHLHCLIISPPKKRGHFMIPNNSFISCLFPFPSLRPVRDNLSPWRPSNIRAIFLDFTKIVARLIHQPIRCQITGHFFGKFPHFHVQQMIRGPNFEVYQDNGFLWIFSMVHPQGLS